MAKPPAKKEKYKLVLPDEDLLPTLAAGEYWKVFQSSRALSDLLSAAKAAEIGPRQLKVTVVIETRLGKVLRYNTVKHNRRKGDPK